MTFDLERFVTAQGPNLDGVLAELRRGRKTSHWMWFVFPQLRGLGRSEMARLYGVESLDEARAYLAHPVLGLRLRACVDALLSAERRSAREVFGEVDALKLRSSMTLFHRAEPAESRFRVVLDRFFGGRLDAATDELLAR